MKFYTLLITFLLISSSTFAQRYELVWSDEFDQAEFDDNTWTEWEGTAYNNEDQYYTPRDTNVYVNDGMLYLVGLRENYGGRQWTSGRIKTQDNFEFQYGKVEIRAKLPAGKGLWPAFWMLGSNIDEPGIGWPYCGEIDIMEYRGHLPSQTSGTVHFSAVSPENSTSSPNADRRYIGEEYNLPSGSFAEDFHLYQFEWSDSEMTWYIDDVEFFKLTRKEIEEQTSYYPFDQPFYLILNLAIGGNFLGDQQPDESTPDRNEVIVDYIRVYQDANKEPKVLLDYNEQVNIESTENLNLEAEVTDEDGTVEKVEFYINDEIIATDSVAPYTVNWSPGIDGCYEFEIKAYDNENKVGTAGPITFIAGTGCEKRSFFDEPHSFPGTLQLEHYDYGGLFNSYYDTTPDSNLGNGQGNNFRTTEAVDIIPDENEEGNYLITEAAAGEWTTYMININQTGIYDLELRVVPGTESGRISFTFDGEDRIYFTNIISQDDQYYTIKTLTGVELQEGAYELEMEIGIDGKGIKPDYLKAELKEATTIYDTQNEQPSSIHLNQNYPNPFNPTTNISFNLPSAQPIKIDIYNSLGQHVENLHTGRLNSGWHNFTFNANELSSGIYYYKLTTGTQVLTQKMLLLK